MFTHNAAALITGPHYHLLDHLVPLAVRLDCPLILAEKKVADLCSLYYPMVTNHYVPYSDLTLRYLSQYDTLISSTFWKPLQKNLFLMLFNKVITLAYLPHGNSDKGHIKPLLEPFSIQDHVFLYGEQMIQHLKRRNIFEKIKSYSVIGNHRLSFYQKHKDHFDKHVKDILSNQLNPTYPTLLYAPTWNDYENLSSFSSALQALIKELPPRFNLIIKPHPLLKERSIDQHVHLAIKKENIVVMEEFPLVYPLLQKVDAYIGDFSSVGYDFLYFQKPMFFIDCTKQDKDSSSTHLFQAGIALDIEKPLYQQILPYLSKWPKDKKDRQKKLYDSAFSVEEKQDLKAPLEEEYKG